MDNGGAPAGDIDNAHRGDEIPNTAGDGVSNRVRLSATNDTGFDIVKVVYSSLIQPDSRNLEVSNSSSYSRPYSRNTSSCEHALSIPLIWNVLGDYLSICDLKCCRLVSKTFARMILDGTNFKDRVIVNVKPGTLTPGEFGKTLEMWKRVKIYINKICCDQSCESLLHDTEWLYPMLAEAQEIHLELGLRACLRPVDRRYRFGPVPATILRSTSKLKKLVAHPKLLEDVIFSNCSKILAKLMSFKVSKDEQEEKVDDELLALVKVAAAAKQLQVFEFQVSMNNRSGHCAFNVKHISRILEENQSHLICLRFQSPQLWESLPHTSFCLLRHKIFPVLKTISVTVSEANKDEVVHFMKNQLPLEVIELDLRSEYPGPFPKDLLKVIKRQHNSRLKILRVDAADFGAINREDFRFLETTQLKEISFWPLNQENLYTKPPVLHAGLLVQSFEFLPPTIERIRLQGSLKKARGIAEVPFAHLSRINENLLTHLCISRMNQGVPAEVMQYIFKYFVKLTTLHLSNLDCRVHDKVMLGRKDTEKASIRNLQSLQYLTLRKCGAITNKTILEGIKLKELKYLDISFNPKITANGCRAVARQNPSLEVLVSDHMITLPPEEERRTVYPRLKCLKAWSRNWDDEQIAPIIVIDSP